MVPLHKRVTPHWEPNWEPFAVDVCGHRLEIYGSEGWGFEFSRACSRNPYVSGGLVVRCMGYLLTFGSHSRLPYRGRWPVLEPNA
jgi:hypothetical protein